MTDIAVETLAERLHERSPTGIAEQVRELINTGFLPGGTRLPIVRDLATVLGVSVGTISQAWSLLRESNLVETRRRGRTLVVDRADLSLSNFRSWTTIDLLHCSPDARFLPSLEEGMRRSLRQPDQHDWSRDHILPELQRAVEKKLVSPVDGAFQRSFAAVSSATEGLWLATKAATSPGDLVAVEEPTPPGYLSVPKSLGLRVISVPVDEDGPVPTALQRALEAGATAFVHTPAGAFSTRHVLSGHRAEELADILHPWPQATVIECDPLGPLSEIDPFVHSLDATCPQQTVRVLGFERVYGADLGTAVLVGPKQSIDRAIVERSGGVSSNSRILQHTLAFLLHDPNTGRRISKARRAYANRRKLALEAFADAGLVASAGPNSWAIWVDVPNERTAAVNLIAQGLIVDVGSNSYVDEERAGNLLRISTAQLPEDRALLNGLAHLVLQATASSLNSTFT